VRSAVLGAGLLLAVTVALALVALLAMLVLAAAAALIAVVLFRIVCYGLRRSLARGQAGRQSVSAHHAHRTRPTGLL
jgi:hypothetical protein